MKMLYECPAMNLSNHATDTYATTKLTTVATIVTPQPTPVEIWSYASTPCTSDAPSRAGMDRKNDNLVTVTRSKSRSSPADMVAPDRDTPGISARHCTVPMIRVSFHV